MNRSEDLVRKYVFSKAIPEALMGSDLKACRTLVFSTQGDNTNVQLQDTVVREVTDYLNRENIAFARKDDRPREAAELDYFARYARPHVFCNQFEEDPEVAAFMLEMAFSSILNYARREDRANDLIRDVISEWIDFGVFPPMIAKLSSEFIKGHIKPPSKQGRRSTQTWGGLISDYEVIYVTEKIIKTFPRAFSKSPGYVGNVFEVVSMACRKISDLKKYNEGKIKDIYYSNNNLKSTVVEYVDRFSSFETARRMTSKSHNKISFKKSIIDFFHGIS